MREYEPEEIERGRLLFAGRTEFRMGAARLDQLPPEYPLEVAFAGRSNVGKSSLLNALTGRKDIARTSNTPGRTRELNYFELADGKVALVDYKLDVVEASKPPYSSESSRSCAMARYASEVDISTNLFEEGYSTISTISG